MDRASLVVACYVLAAVVLYKTGYPNQGKYAVMAVAMLPQLAMLLRARSDTNRRDSLRVSRRPMPLHAAIAVALAATAITVFARNGITFGPGWAAAVAATAATLAACPPVVWFPARSRRHPGSN